MVTDVTDHAQKLPDSWNARLHDDLFVSERRSRKGKQSEPGLMKPNVLLQPTKPANDNGLPAFRIKQEIAPQPSTETYRPKTRLKDLRIGLVIAVIAIVGLAIYAIATFGSLPS